MATENVGQMVTEKLDKNNLPAWKFRMTNFLMGKGYWDYIEGDLEEAPEIPEENAQQHRSKHSKNGIKGQER